MVEISPDGLDKVMFGCTGSDANEFALKLAKYFRGGGRIISFRRGFHGSTAGAAAATGKSEMIQENSGISELLPRGLCILPHLTAITAILEKNLIRVECSV